MAKNEYRRQLIMLRGLEKGYSGHARLEKRVTMGSMDIVATTPGAEETLEAALIGPRGNALAAKPLGRLKTDSRGQRALLASFDPRNIAGMDLSGVTCAVIARVDASGVTPVLMGYINGAKPVNWPETEKLLTSMYVRNEGAPAAPPDAAQSGTEPSIQPSDSPSIPPPDGNAQAEPIETPAPAESAPAKPDGQTSKEKPFSGSPAGAYLDIDMSRPWPEDVEGLRLLFLTGPVYEPFKKDGYVFVRANMAEETGVSHCAVGVKAENGRISGVCYAIPMPYSPNPPAGLEGYEWMGDTNTGWWITCDDIGSDD